MNISEKSCKSLLSKSELYGIDYSINPYTGCEHGCEYCYATFMKRFSKHSEPWGDFIDVKKGIEKILKKDLKKTPKGEILISSVTDPYQPIEEKYKNTRKIIKILSEEKWPVNILTKNKLILRDLDIFRNFDNENLSLGFTINFLNEKHRKIWEPDTSKISERIEALKKISKENMNTYAHVGPYLPKITNLKKITEKTSPYIQELQIESINFKRKKKILKIIKNNYPEFFKKYKNVEENLLNHEMNLKEKVDKIRNEYDTKLKLYI